LVWFKNSSSAPSSIFNKSGVLLWKPVTQLFPYGFLNEQTPTAMNKGKKTG